MRTRCLALFMLLIGSTASAQPPAIASSPPSISSPPRQTLTTLPQAVFGSVPDEQSTPDLQLSLADAIARSLRHNLAVLSTEYSVEAARGSRWRALSELLPAISTRASRSEQVLNLAAFGFPPPPGGSSIVGPFSVIDARVFLTQSVLDFRAINDARAQGKALDAARLQVKNARDLVVLVTANLYSQVIATASRAEAAHAQLVTAERVHNRALDLRNAGVVAGIDVLRAQVQMETQRQRAIAADNDVQKAKLQLARVIGLAAGQQFALSDTMPYAPLESLSLEDALATAYRSRADFQAAQALVDAAEAERRAATAERWPSVQVNADYGDIGPTFANSHSTFSVTASVRVPVFEASRTIGRVLDAQSQLHQRQAELADFKSRIDFEVRTALLDLNAAAQQVAVAATARDLANEQLTQAQDRFAAGVAGGLETVQAQEAVATANESYIASVYAHNLAKGALARALGVTEASMQTFLKGSR
jgi:outer membrane protein TolC